MSVDEEAALFEARFRTDATIPLADGTTIVLEQSDGESSPGETEQATVWTGGRALTAALQDHNLLPIDWTKIASVIELGSGTGLCGIMAAKLGAQEVVLTDLPPLVPLLQRNAARNRVANVTRAQCLDWREPNLPIGLPVPDIILGSDITVFIQQNEALAIAMAKLCAPHTRILLAAQDRGDATFLLQELSKRFHCERVPYSPGSAALGDEYGGGKGKTVEMLILSMTRRDRGADDQEAEEATRRQDEIDAACRGDIAAMKRRLRAET